jgi:hypothetical protein
MTEPRFIALAPRDSGHRTGVATIARDGRLPAHTRHG